MSLGYLDDEENPPIEGPPALGSADEFIAGVNAQPLAAPISPEAPDETAFPPPVPTEAPGMVPTAPPVPGFAGQNPPVPGFPGNVPALPGTVPPLGSIADVSQAGAKAIGSRRKADEAQLGVLQAGEPQGAETAALAQEKADNARLEQADIEEKAQASAAAEAQATKIYDQAAAAKRNFQFHDYWSDKSTARRVGSALAVAFGAYGAAMTHTQNYALEILNKSMDDDHRNQVDQFQKLTDAEAQARTGIADAHAAKIQGLTDIGTKWAAANRSIAATAEAVAAKTADAEGKAKLLAFAQDLNAKADETEYTTKQGIYKSILANEAARLKNENLQAQTRYLNAKSGKLGRAGAGGGNSNLSALSTAAEEGKTLKDITAMPEARGVKFDTIKKIYDEGQKLAGDNNPDIVAADKRAASVKDKELFGQRGPATQLERIEAMQTELRAALKSGDKTAATRVLEEAGGMLSGGKSTKNTVELLHSLQSSSDELSAKWNKITGDPGATKEYTARLEKLLGGTAEEKRQEIDDIRKRYISAEVGQHGMAKRPQTKDRVLGHAQALFGSVRNSNGQPRYEEGGGESAPASAGVQAAAPARAASSVDQEALAYYNAQTAAGNPVPPNVVNGLRAKGLIK